MTQIFRRRDGRSAQEVREGAAKRLSGGSASRQSEPRRSGARSQASAAASSRQRGQIHQRVALGGRHAGAPPAMSAAVSAWLWPGQAASTSSSSFDRVPPAEPCRKNRSSADSSAVNCSRSRRPSAAVSSAGLRPRRGARGLSWQPGIGGQPNGNGAAAVGQDAPAVQPLARAADGRRGDGRLRSAQHAVGERGRDAERVVGQPLDRGRVQVDPAMEQPGQRHAGPGAVAGQLEAAIQHAQAHDAQRLPFQRRHRIGQHLARVAARPVRGLAAQPVIGMARRGGDGARLQDPETLAVPGPFQVVALRRVVQRAGRVRAIAPSASAWAGVSAAARASSSRVGRRPVPWPSASGRLAWRLAPIRLAARRHDSVVASSRSRYSSPRPAADQRLAQAPVGVDQHLVMASADRIAGEGDARDARSISGMTTTAMPPSPASPSRSR